MLAYRIADARHPIFDPTGAMLHGGRWNSIGSRVIYAAASYAGAMLEVLVHSNLSMPPKNHRVVLVTIPDYLTVETLNPSALPGWESEDPTVSRDFGDKWLSDLRSVALRVPSVITEGREHNILINPLHPAFSRISSGAPEEIHWDTRLFRVVQREKSRTPFRLVTTTCRHVRQKHRFHSLVMGKNRTPLIFTPRSLLRTGDQPAR